MNNRLDPPAAEQTTRKTLLLGAATERHADMKNALEQKTRQGFMLQQLRGRAPGIKRLRGRLGHALGAVLALALLLFALPDLLAVITGAYARTPNQLSASAWAARPTKTPPPRRSPTPTTVPSPTAPATPSPTFTATPTTR